MQDTRLKYLREEYTTRVNRVIDYIEANIREDLSLKKLAEVVIGYIRCMTKPILLGDNPGAYY